MHVLLAVVVLVVGYSWSGIQGPYIHIHPDHDLFGSSANAGQELDSLAEQNVPK